MIEISLALCAIGAHQWSNICQPRQSQWHQWTAFLSVNWCPLIDWKAAFGLRNCRFSYANVRFVVLDNAKLHEQLFELLHLERRRNN